MVAVPGGIPSPDCLSQDATLCAPALNAVFHDLSTFRFERNGDREARASFGPCSASAVPDTRKRKTCDCAEGYFISTPNITGNRLPS